MQPSRQFALRLRPGELPDQLALREGKAATRHAGAEIVLQTGQSPVSQQRPELQRRFPLDGGVHEWNIPAVPMV